MSLLIFILVLSILIVVHEWGHYWAARSVGVKVDQFSVGFGPKLFSFKHDGTEFMLCAIPLGGFVKMAGDERANCKGDPAEYYSKSVGARAKIVAMGPIVNYVLAYLCFILVFTLGYPTRSAKIGEVLDGYPGKIAGLQKGDTIVQINQQPVQSWEDVPKLINQSTMSDLRISLMRGNQKIEKTIIPKQQMRKNIFGQMENVKMIGVSPEDEIVVLKFGFFESIQKSFQHMIDLTSMTYKALYRMVTGGMSVKDMSGAGGPTGLIGLFYIIKTASTMGISTLLYVFGAISASLAIFNVLPLPVLDGGHLLFLAIEKIRGKALSQKTEERIAKVGMSFIICLAVFVFYIDFVRFGVIDKAIGIFKKIGL